MKDTRCSTDGRRVSRQWALYVQARAVLERDARVCKGDFGCEGYTVYGSLWTAKMWAGRSDADGPQGVRGPGVEFPSSAVGTLQVFPWHFFGLSFVETLGLSLGLMQSSGRRGWRSPVGVGRKVPGRSVPRDSRSSWPTRRL